MKDIVYEKEFFYLRDGRLMIHCADGVTRCAASVLLSTDDGKLKEAIKRAAKLLCGGDV